MADDQQYLFSLGSLGICRGISTFYKSIWCKNEHESVPIIVFPAVHMWMWMWSALS